jgi:hypothetical protein
MPRSLAVTLAVCLASTCVAGQAPPVELARSASAQMVRAAGMPLPDGTLPPGSLTVRLVQGAFAGDLTGITVELETDGSGTRRAVTAGMGRAEFAHVPIGAIVRATAMVSGESLSSEAFSMPAESGVRLLLVARAGTGTSNAVGSATTSPSPRSGVSLPPATVTQRSTTTALSGDASRATNTTAASLLAAITAIAFGLVGAQWWSRRLQDTASSAGRD